MTEEKLKELIELKSQLNDISKFYHYIETAKFVAGDHPFCSLYMLDINSYKKIDLKDIVVITEIKEAVRKYLERLQKEFEES